MSERGSIESEEKVESRSLEETKESVESRSLEEATHDPGTRVEQIGSLGQAEAIESTVKGLVDSSLSTGKLAGDQKGAADISKGLVDKELPEGAQKQKELLGQKELDDIFGDDLDSLTPGPGKLTDPYGKEQSDTGGSEFGTGFDSAVNPKFGTSGESSTGEEHPGAGLFAPGKGPGGGVEADDYDSDYPDHMVNESYEVMEMIVGGASESEIAAKEKQLQEAALDEYELIWSPKSSTPEDEGGSDIGPPTKEEVERAIEKASGDEISMKDPDSPGSEETDGSVLPKYADELKAAAEKISEVKHARKKAGAEVVTDPVPGEPGESGQVKGKKEAK